MKILFITTEHPAQKFGGLGTFTKEYIAELRKFCTVKTVYFHLRDCELPTADDTIDYVFSPKQIYEAFTSEGKVLATTFFFRHCIEPILEDFKPDVIHCNERQTYLPFRLDDNVLYSSHLIFTDILSITNIDDSYFEEVKVEKSAMITSPLVAVYSNFAQKRSSELYKNNNTIVLPLGLDTQKFNRYYCKRPAKENELHISYFGRFENIQKGFLNFIQAVNLLGKSFKEKNNISFYLYGKGIIPEWVDLSLFEESKFLEGEDLLKAYQSSDIVIMPSKYEPFGLTGLEAMATGALTIMTKGLGMDMYAKFDENCLGTTGAPKDIAICIQDAVINFNKYEQIRINAHKDAMNWTWNNCVEAHLFVYEQIKQKKINNFLQAYNNVYRNIISSFRNASLFELNSYLNFEKHYMKIVDSNQKSDMLILKASDIMYKNWKIPLNLECLPFENKSKTETIVFGLWEMIQNVETAFYELTRVTKSSISIYYNVKTPFSWQTIQMENYEDWKNIENEDWKIQNIRELEDYNLIEFVSKEYK